MRETYPYTGKDYGRDNNFRQSWILKEIFTRGARASVEEEIKEYNLRHDNARNGKIIGKPAGREAYLGKSAKYYRASPGSVVPVHREEQEERRENRNEGEGYRRGEAGEMSGDSNWRDDGDEKTLVEYEASELDESSHGRGVEEVRSWLRSVPNPASFPRLDQAPNFSTIQQSQITRPSMAAQEHQSAQT